VTTNIYVSPHLDDAVFSCGGLISRQVRDGQDVMILTVMAGDPPGGVLSELASELHRSWGMGADATSRRREEDVRSCGVLGAKAFHLRWLDAIYRRWVSGHVLYPSVEALFGALQQPDLAALEDVAADLRDAISLADNVYCPLGIGRHVDHRLVRLATERLRLPLNYFMDLPYAARSAEMPTDLENPQGERTTISLEEYDLAIWGKAVEEYRSQSPAYWRDRDKWHRRVSEFLAREGGLPLIHSQP